MDQVHHSSLVESLRAEGWSWLACTRAPRPGAWAEHDARAALWQARRYFAMARIAARQLAGLA